MNHPQYTVTLEDWQLANLRNLIAEADVTPGDNEKAYRWIGAAQVTLERIVTLAHLKESTVPEPRADLSAVLDSQEFHERMMDYRHAEFVQAQIEFDAFRDYLRSSLTPSEGAK